MFPSGKVVKNGEIKDGANAVIKEMQKNKLTGYVASTVKGKNGITDWSVAFANGAVKGAFFENFKTKERLTGENALKQIETTTGNGFYDVVALSEEQVNLAIAVRPESEVKTIPLQTQTEESGEEILKKYGLSSLMGHV